MSRSIRPVRRALAVSWALGTSAGVFLGLLGVQLVTSGIRDGRVAPMSRPEVLQALAAGRRASVPPPVTAPPVEDAPAAAEAGPAMPPPAPPPTNPPAAPRARVAAPPLPPPSPPPAPPTTTAPPARATPATTAPPTPATTVPPSPPAGDSGRPDNQGGSTIRTISAQGGTVAVRYTGGRVELVWARPKAGYDVSVKSEGPKNVVVRFSNKSHSSWVVAYYDDSGRPSHDVTERQGGGASDEPPGGVGRR